VQSEDQNLCAPLLYLSRPMSKPRFRNTISTACLWIAILAMTISLGGNLFQMMVVDPLWSAAPPGSVQTYFSNVQHFEALRRFHQNPFFFFGLFCFLASVVFYWNHRNLRRWLLIGFVIEAAIIIGTIFYVYPINDVLMTHHAADISPTAAVELTHHWLVADRFRFLMKIAVVLSLLRALQLSGAEQRA
jgi:hypothetical protein